MGGCPPAGSPAGFCCPLARSLRARLILAAILGPVPVTCEHASQLEDLVHMQHSLRLQTICTMHQPQQGQQHFLAYTWPEYAQPCIR